MIFDVIYINVMYYNYLVIIIVDLNLICYENYIKNLSILIVIIYRYVLI